MAYHAFGQPSLALLLPLTWFHLSPFMQTSCWPFNSMAASLLHFQPFTSCVPHPSSYSSYPPIPSPCQLPHSLHSGRTLALTLRTGDCASSWHRSERSSQHHQLLIWSFNVFPLHPGMALALSCSPLRGATESFYIFTHIV